MKYKQQLITVFLKVEVAPANLLTPGAITYVNIPESFNVFRITIRNDEDSAGGLPSVNGLYGTIQSESVYDYSVISFSKQAYPFILEAKNGYIVDGFYLAVSSPNIGDVCLFHVLFEGEIQ